MRRINRKIQAGFETLSHHCMPDFSPTLGSPPRKGSVTSAQGKGGGGRANIAWRGLKMILPFFVADIKSKKGKKKLQSL